MIIRRIIWVFFGIVLLEILLRVGGFAYLDFKDYQNRLDKGDEDTYRILCLGESTTEQGGVYSWPAQLETILNERIPGKKFIVLNGGRSGINTAFLLLRLEDTLEEHKPDRVIIMIGANDEVLYAGYQSTLITKIVSLLQNFRLYKLTKLIWAALKININKITQINGNSVGLTVINSNSKEDYTRLGNYYRELGRFEEAEEIFKKAIEVNPNNSLAYTQLGAVYFAQSKFEKAEEMFKKAIELNSYDFIAYSQLGNLYSSLSNFKEAEKMYKKAIEINPNQDSAYTNLERTFRKMGVSDEEIEKFYREKGFSFKIRNSTTSYAVTKDHYKQLYNTLNKRGIKLVAMQYPTRNVDELRGMFEGNEDIIFVSNEENFQKALEVGRYEDYFIDRCYNSFGHGTAKGNRLIAENVADAILKDLKT